MEQLAQEYKFVGELEKRKDLDQKQFNHLRKCQSQILAAVKEEIQEIKPNPVELPKKLTLKHIKINTQNLKFLNQRHSYLKEAVRSHERKVAYYESNKNSRELIAWNFLMSVMMLVTYLLSVATIVIESFIPLESYFKSQFIHIIIGQIGVHESFYLIMTIVIYLIVCAIFSLANIKWKFLKTFEKNNTDFRSFIFYIENASVIAPALCFNFLTIFELDNAEFFAIMGHYNIVPLFGNHIPKLFPLLLAFFCLFFLFKNFFIFWNNNKKAFLANQQSLHKSLVISFK